ncbi:hypothetical protein ASPCADRAFT_209186 [Aspergillus carbonarius ITEM 5010]|uniref:Uncharacterized protein n=1 Tax=Aspergillus carbonarius (strain ITEM 5010) TaxID=602072 RepID=A0A1R3RHJ4_ASPC5|nr:hypothetical protein ASPCADRAFT_209186 [Aspergillus carbonarius ITEM 5010]
MSRSQLSGRIAPDLLVTRAMYHCLWEIELTPASRCPSSSRTSPPRTVAVAAAAGWLEVVDASDAVIHI